MSDLEHVNIIHPSRDEGATNSCIITVLRALPDPVERVASLNDSAAMGINRVAVRVFPDSARDASFGPKHYDEAMAAVRMIKMRMVFDVRVSGQCDFCCSKDDVKRHLM